MSVHIEWYAGSAFNHGRIPGTSIRVERFNTGNKESPNWRFLIATDEITYLAVGPVGRDGCKTRQELEDEIIKACISKGLLLYAH